MSVSPSCMLLCVPLLKVVEQICFFVIFSLLSQQANIKKKVVSSKKTLLTRLAELKIASPATAQYVVGKKTLLTRLVELKIVSLAVVVGKCADVKTLKNDTGHWCNDIRWTSVYVA